MILFKGVTPVSGGGGKSSTGVLLTLTKLRIAQIRPKMQHPKIRKCTHELLMIVLMSYSGPVVSG